MFKHHGHFLFLKQPKNNLLNYGFILPFPDGFPEPED
jgi:hypothetical protein